MHSLGTAGTLAGSSFSVSNTQVNSSQDFLSVCVLQLPLTKKMEAMSPAFRCFSEGDMKVPLKKDGHTVNLGSDLYARNLE